MKDVPLSEAAEKLESEAGRDLTVTGTVSACSAASSGIRLSVSHLTIRRKDNSEQTLLPRLIITVTSEQEEIMPGDKIVASGQLMLWEPASNPGQFDTQEYYFAQNIVGMLAHAQIEQVFPGSESLARFLYRLRRMLGSSYERILGEKQAKMMEAVSLGEKGLLTQEWKEFYQEGGIAHILAVSGLHISLIGMCVYRLLRSAGLSFGLCGAASGAVTVLYAGMTGSGISARRAVLMFCFWLGAQFFGRKYDMLTAAAAAAAILLLRDERYLSLSSFLLSFCAVLTIALLLPCIDRVFLTPDYEKRGTGAGNARMGGQLQKSLLSCAGIWLGTLPVTLYYFYQTAPWSILLNLAVVPLMSVLMTYGLLAAAAGLISPSLGIFLASPVYYILECIDFLCNLLRKLPSAVWVAGQPPVWRILLYYGILLTAGGISCLLLKKWRGDARGIPSGGIGRRRRQIRRKTALSLLWILCAAVCTDLMGPHGNGGGNGDLEIVCLDVGQGDGALLRLPGDINCLIDGGSSSETDVWQYRIGQAVKYYGVRTLDYIFLSHADQDHISGVTEYLQDYEPGFGGENVHGITLKCLVLPPAADEQDFQELRILAGEKKIQVLQMEAGAVIGTGGRGEYAAANHAADSARRSGTEPVGQTVSGVWKGVRKKDSGWSISCLAPASSALCGDRNEDSMVLMLQYGEFHMLFTGDLEGDAEQQLARSGKMLKADVLKVGHHGSKNASSQEFLEQVRPALAVISCGENNSYGHPARETLERLRKAGCRMLVTPQSGAVMIRTDGSKYSVRTYKDG